MHILMYLKSDVNTATYRKLLCTYLKLFILETKYWRMNKPKLNFGYSEKATKFKKYIPLKFDAMYSLTSNFK